MRMTRRSLIGACAGAALSTCSCAQPGFGARLTARPGQGGKPFEPGTHPLELRAERDTLLYVPKLANPDQPAPLVLYLHGATGSEQQGVRRIGPLAEQLGFLLLSPGSASGTWDAIRGSYNEDVSMIDRALAKTFAAHRVDARKIAVCGFSDGASYALGLGLSNGELFGSVLAFSPGFIPPGWKASGPKPKIFISHGTQDEILPIDQASRRLAPELKRAGYAVNYREFDGPHMVQPELAGEGLRWALG